MRLVVQCELRRGAELLPVSVDPDVGILYVFLLTRLILRSLNSDPEHNPYFPKKKAADLQHDDKFLINL